MSVRNRFALLVSILVAAICIYLPFVAQTVLPIAATPLDNHHYRIAESSYAFALPTGLQAGDVLDTARMDMVSRFGLITYALVPPGTRINLMVQRQNREVVVPVAFARMPLTVLNLLDVVLGIALIWLVAALGLLTLWRGHRLAAAGLGIWCLAKLCWEVPISLPLPLPAAGWADMIGTALFYAGTLVGLYLLADDLALEHVDDRVRRRGRIGFMALVAVYLILFVGNDLAFRLRGVWWFNPTRINVRVIAHLFAFAVPLAMLALRYRHVRGEDRARIRWVSWSVSCIVATYLLDARFGLIPISDVWNDILYSLLTSAAFIGFTYAILQHRLVAVSVVMNRVLVYGAATTLVVVAFSLIEGFLAHTAIENGVSLTIALAASLLLGLLLHRIHRYIDHWVEYLFFRRQLRAEVSLSQFIRECGFITSPQVLVGRTIEAVLKHIGAPAVAIYEYAGNGYRQLRQQGTHDFPAHLSLDDPACVRLRANLAETDLDGLGSALDEEGVVFPAILRGVLIGALVCSARPGEQYTPSERALLQRVARETGASLHAMYVDQTRAFITDVANGTLPSSEPTQASARRLAKGELTA